MRLHRKKYFCPFVEQLSDVPGSVRELLSISATLAVARKLVAYLLAVDRRQSAFERRDPVG